MGTVYLAYHEILNRPVALKVPKRELSSSDHFVQRFLREAKALGTLHHRNIVTVYDAGIENDTPYIAMKYIAGKTLSELIRASGQIDIDKVISWGRQIADALAYLHDQQILHRDLKGANVIIDQAGNAIVADFGIAQIEADSSLTRGVLGTPSYMSPEQAMGKDLDARSDMHGLGVLLYQCLTGQLPFQDDNSYALIQKVIHETPSPVSDFRPETPIWLENIVHKCLKKHPGQRFKDDRAVLAAFDNALTRPVIASKALTFLPARRRLSLVAPDPPPKQSSVRVLDLIQSRSNPISARLDSEHTITISGPAKNRSTFLHTLVQHGIFLSCAALVALVLVAPLALSQWTSEETHDATALEDREMQSPTFSSNEITLTNQEEPSSQSTTHDTLAQQTVEPPTQDSLPTRAQQPAFSAEESTESQSIPALPLAKIQKENIVVIQAPEDITTEPLDATPVLEDQLPATTPRTDIATPAVITELLGISTRRELIRALETFRKIDQIRYGNKTRVHEPDFAYIFLMNSSNEGLHAVLVPSASGWTDVYSGRDFFQEQGAFYTQKAENKGKSVVENIDPIWVEVIERKPTEEPAALKRRVTGW